MSEERILGKYRLLEQLGKGGFSKVYRAENLSLGNEVAIKILDPVLAQDDSFVRRFRREARRTALLDHPNIVRVLDLDQVDGEFFIAMEYMPSKDLHDLLASGELLPLERAVSVVRQIGAALDYAHARALVHRDVKPGNVLVREDGTVKLTDFGLVHASEGSRLTQTGTTMGTPSYMSPEQTRGTEVDGRADLYALGVMAYEFITGRVPFAGDTPVSTAYMHVHESPPSPSSIAQRAGGSIEAVLLKALAKDPNDRYQSGKALANALATAVYDIEEDSLIQTYDQAVTLLESRRFGDALKQLERVKAAQPDYRDVATLIIKAEEGRKLSGLYRQANEYLVGARDLASQVAAIDPDFPDTQKVFQTIREGSGGQAETDDALADLFDQGLTAYIDKRWLRARNLLNELEQQQPGYARAGQRVSDLLAEAQKQLSSTRQGTAVAILQSIGRAILVLAITLVILAGLHVILVRPAIEDTLFDLASSNLDTLVEPEVFQGRAEDCEVVTAQNINRDIANSLRDSPFAGQIEVRLEEETFTAVAELGAISASINTRPVVIIEDGMVKLDDFSTNWLLRLIFSKNGLRTFAENYINNDILKDGRMWLEDVTIEDGEMTLCVTPRD
ncbi:MAG: protein kinase [Chloroflexi bacterium]|nr:protein kinase [Chloroflexota bacterium]